MNTLRVAISANCQGGPIGNLLGLMSDQVEISHVTIVHRARDDDSEDALKAFEAADFILAQKVADNYPCSFVRTNELRDRYGPKVLSWVNLYYSGYNPEMVYVRDSRRIPMNGPLGDYHLKPVIESYQDGQSIDHAVARLSDLDYNALHYSGSGEASLTELKQRDADTDVKIVDYVERRLPAAKQFHTFNHPSLDLLIELAARMAHAMGASVQRRPSAGMLPEPLGMIMAPLNPQSRRETGFTAEPAPLTFRGVPLEWSEGGCMTLRGPKLYSVDETVENYYRRYDLDPDAIAAVQVHPS